MNYLLLPTLLQSFIRFLQSVILVVKQWQNLKDFDYFVVLKCELDCNLQNPTVHRVI